MFLKQLFPAIPKLIPDVWITRGLVVALIFFALAAGYFQTVLEQERKRYLRLEDAYVRVRSELGREETQRLIDQSRQTQPE